MIPLMKKLCTSSTKDGTTNRVKPLGEYNLHDPARKILQRESIFNLAYVVNMNEKKFNEL